jgi:hypothetical protein
MSQINHHKTTGKVIPFRRRRAPAYPNAAERGYLAHRLLDYALTAATSAGIVTALMCMFTFF